MDVNVLEYLKKNKKGLGKIDFESFFESNDFNNMNENSKRTVFYFNIFLMSSKKYNYFNEIINDFIKITSKINENDYLKNTHECYEQIIINYLDKISSFFISREKDTLDNQKEFIQLLDELVEQIGSIYYPNEKMKRNIIKYLDRLEKFLDERKEDINQEYLKRFQRYQGKLNKYIAKLKNNSINGKENNNIYVKNNSSFPNNCINMNDNLNNNFIQNNNYEIVNNSLNRNNSSLRDSKLYNDSLMPFNQNYIKNEAEEETESDEESKLKIKYQEIDNFIDNEIIPKYFEPKKDEIQESLKLANLKDEINEDQNNMNNDSIKANISNLPKKKKKKKKKKNAQNCQNNQNIQNDINNLAQNLNGVYKPAPSMANMNIPIGVYIPQIRPGEFPIYYPQPIQSNNNFYPMYPYQINNNYDMNQNQSFMNNKRK